MDNSAWLLKYVFHALLDISCDSSEMQYGCKSSLSFVSEKFIAIDNAMALLVSWHEEDSCRLQKFWAKR